MTRKEDPINPLPFVSRALEQVSNSMQGGDKSWPLIMVVVFIVAMYMLVRWLDLPSDYQSAVSIAGLPLLAFGDAPRAWLAIGAAPIGVIAIGGVAVGVIAIGGIAAGAVAIGGLALAFYALAGLSLGAYAYAGGGIAIGVIEAQGKQYARVLGQRKDGGEDL